MKRLDQLLMNKNSRVVNIYFTAGYPSLDSTMSIISLLEKHGAGLIEVGMPFSDPLADGPVIQESSRIALENGMNTDLLFEQLKSLRTVSQIPVVLMGYLNPVLQYGMEKFLSMASSCGIDGLILPDLPPEVYESQYISLFEKHEIYPIFLITPQTKQERIHYLDSLSKGFLYAVSSSSTTGGKSGFNKDHLAYFERLASTDLKNPLMIGFGISNNESLETVFRYASGAIVGSAFIKNLNEKTEDFGIPAFMNHLLNKTK